MIKKTRLVGAFDIETTTTEQGAFAYAFTLLETDNIEDVSRETITIFREPLDFQNSLHNIIVGGRLEHYTPVIVSYNLAFDFAGIAEEVARFFYVREFRTSSGLLAIDLYTFAANMAEEPPALRFWNVQPFVPQGLARMGELAGVQKLEGGLDYNLTRSRSTPLTPEERNYCEADVRIITAFLRFLLEEFQWLRADDFGRVCLSPASVLRLYQNRRVSPLRAGAKNIGQEWHALTHRDREHATEEQKLLRREAYAGGFTFTTPTALFRTVEVVNIFDMDSAYHWALCHLPLVTGFRLLDDSELPLMQSILRENLATFAAAELSSASLLAPLGRMRGHFRVRFRGLRPRGGAWSTAQRVGYISARRADVAARRVLNATGEDTAKVTAESAEFVLGRITRARSLTITADEYELAAIALAYEWERLELLAAEVATRKAPPHAFTRLSSVLLREEKKARKSRGGAEYGLFKTIYNSQAGIYAELEKDGFTNAYLPTAIRQTSFTRLSLFIAAQFCTDKGLSLVSGDTDSLRVQGEADKISSALKYHAALLAGAETPATDLEEDMTGLDLTEAMIGLGYFVHEREALALREMGAKARAWIENDGTREVFRIKYAGMRTGKLEAAANTTRSPREWLADMQPWTWIDESLVKNVKREQTAKGLQIFEGTDYRGKDFKLEASPCISLQDELVCIALPFGETAKRLKQAGIFEGISEGWLNVAGRKEIK